MLQKFIKFLGVAVQSTITSLLWADVVPAPLFSNGMVLQQEYKIPVWGTADPDEKVQLTFAGETLQTKADKQGFWILTLKPQKANSVPQEMLLKGKKNEVKIQDILIGEVVLAGGQSNMEVPIKESENPLESAAEANDPLIREFKVVHDFNVKLQNEFRGKWVAVTPEVAPDICAVSYYYARKIHQTLKVPVGIVNNAYSATPAQSWVAEEVLRNKADLYKYYVRDMDTYLPMGKENIIATREKLGQSFVYKDLRRNEENYVKRYAGSRLIDKHWKDCNLPGELERVYGEVDGTFWFRKSVTIPKEWAGKSLQLILGAIDDGDITYFNGVKIGSIDSTVPGCYDMKRQYTVPADLVKAGNAVIAIRCFDSAHAGGFWGPKLELRLDENNVIDLAGTWKTKAEEILDPLPWPAEFVPLVKIYRVGSVLYNAMLYPLRRYPVRNVIWYQGESNAGDGVIYETLFQDLIQNWRDTLEQPELPFYFVQLAAYKMPVKNPTPKTTWPITRAAQEKALEMPNTGMVTAIDIGDAVRIHPLKKKEVGERLAGLALERIYGVKGAELVYPRAEKTAKRTASGLLVTIKTSGAALKMPADGKINCLAIQNRKGTWQWASEKSRVVKIDEAAGMWGIEIPCENSADIQAVRYAWEINPEVNVFDEKNAPLLPFECKVQ